MADFIFHSVALIYNSSYSVYEHRNDLVEGFTKKYRLHLLVHYEQCADVSVAIWREKRLKKWKRTWKIQLIESNNPEWRDLYPELI